MACSYSTPCSFSNPNNPVPVVFGYTMKAPNHWNWYTCSASNPSWVNAAPNCSPTLESKLIAWAGNMNHYAYYYGPGMGHVSWIGHLGAYTPGKPNCSYHRTGDAIDLAWIQWQNPYSSRPCNGPGEAQSTHRHRRLLAVEAGLRKQFGYVLNRQIPQHHNHFHVDSGCSVAMHTSWSSTARQYSSTAYFIQNCVNRFTGLNIAEDGDWGTNTENGFNHLKALMGMASLNPKGVVSHYMLFLDYLMMHGFANKPAGHFRWVAY